MVGKHLILKLLKLALYLKVFVMTILVLSAKLQFSTKLLLPRMFPSGDSMFNQQLISFMTFTLEIKLYQLFCIEKYAYIPCKKL